MSGVCISLNGTIADLQIPAKTKDVLEFLRKKYKNPNIQFQGKLQNPSNETRMLNIFASINEDDDNVNSHMLPSPFDEEVYNSSIIVLATENDESDSYISNVAEYVSLKPHEYETLYQEWTFAVNEDDEEVDGDVDEVEDEVLEEVYEEVEEETPTARPVPKRSVTKVSSRDAFVDCAIREKVVENFTDFLTKSQAKELEHHMLQSVVDIANKEGYDVDWTNRTFWNMYRTRAISLYENLNPTSYVQNKENLLEKLKSGELTFKFVAEMSPIDLCPSRWKYAIERIIESEKKLYSTQKSASIFLWCSSCKKKSKCDYYQLQTRSADEPMTTFVNCLECGKKWKF